MSGVYMTPGEICFWSASVGPPGIFRSVAQVLWTPPSFAQHAGPAHHLLSHGTPAGVGGSQRREESDDAPGAGWSDFGMNQQEQIDQLPQGLGLFKESNYRQVMSSDVFVYIIIQFGGSLARTDLTRLCLVDYLWQPWRWCWWWDINPGGWTHLAWICRSCIGTWWCPLEIGSFQDPVSYSSIYRFYL